MVGVTGVVAGGLGLADAVPSTASGRDALAFGTLGLPVIATFAWQGASWQATLGKRRWQMIVSTRVEGRPSGKQIIVRHVVKFDPWQAADPAHRSLHDRIAGTRALTIR